MAEAFDKEKDNVNQLKAKLTKTKEDLSFHRSQVVEKDEHLNGITIEVNKYSKHLKELIEDLEKVVNTLFFLIFSNSFQLQMKEVKKKLFNCFSMK